MPEQRPPHCSKYHPDVIFVPYIGIGKDGKFGQVGWTCPFICPEIMKQWEIKRQQTKGFINEPETECDKNIILFEKTVELK